jgi:predicted MFS family arabinose efflux permease
MLVRLIGRRALIVGAALVAAVCVLAMGFVPSRDAVIAITVLRAGLFNMVLPVYRALVIDAAPRREHTITAFTLALAENIGATPAPRLSGGLQKAFGYGPVFVLSALLYGAGAVVFAWAAKAPETPRKSTS